MGVNACGQFPLNLADFLIKYGFRLKKRIFFFWMIYRSLSFLFIMSRINAIVE